MILSILIIFTLMRTAFVVFRDHHTAKDYVRAFRMHFSGTVPSVKFGKQRFDFIAVKNTRLCPLTLYPQ